MHNSPVTFIKPLLLLKARLVQLDLLRAVAVVLVMLYHFNCYIAKIPLWNDIVVNGGQTGVNIFFTLSGLLIALPFVKENLEHSRMPDIYQYVVNRILRIVPLFWAVTLVSYTCREHIQLYEQLRPEYTITDIWLHLVFLSSRLNVLNPVVWTLRIEVLVYIIFPLLWWITLRWNKYIIHHIYPITTLGFLFFLIYRIVYIQIYHQIPYEDIISNLECFWQGILIALLLVADKEQRFFRIPFPVLLPVIVLIALMKLSQLEVSPDLYFPFFRSFCNAGIFMLFIGLLRKRMLPIGIGIRAAVFISAISYSIYLLHFNIYYNMVMPLMQQALHTTVINNWLYVLPSILITVVLSLLTYGLIEEPFLSFKNGVKAFTFKNGFATVLYNKRRDK